MKNLILAILIVISTISASYALPDNFLGIKFDGTVDQIENKIPVPDGQRGATDLNYYFTDNMQMDGKDVGSLTLGYKKDTGKFYSLDLQMVFFEEAKRSKAIKMPEGNYVVMGQAPLAEEYFQLLYNYFSSNYGESKMETSEAGPMTLKTYKWDRNTGGLFINLYTGYSRQAKQTIVSCIILKIS